MKVKSQRDFFSGLLLIFVGAAFAIGATGYNFGAAVRPGPGYFPFGLGITNLLRATAQEPRTTPWAGRCCSVTRSTTQWSRPPLECSRKNGDVVYAASSWMCLNPSSYSCGVK